MLEHWIDIIIYALGVFTLVFVFATGVFAISELAYKALAKGDKCEKI